jgi:hypothetical protein
MYATCALDSLGACPELAAPTGSRALGALAQAAVPLWEGPMLTPPPTRPGPCCPQDEFYNEDELEEGPELLGGVEEDAQLPGEVPAWSPLVSSSSEAVKTQAGGLRSLVWPGAFCGARGKDWTNVYVGWGVKNAPFVPMPPPPVSAEFDLGATETLELTLKPAPPAPEADEEDE